LAPLGVFNVITKALTFQLSTKDWIKPEVLIKQVGYQRKYSITFGNLSVHGEAKNI
jgi:hypothetical protein